MIWQQDKAVTDLIAYFNQPGIAPSQDGKSGGWLRLSTKPQELKVVQSQLLKCRADFSYFARNYLRINDAKNRREIPFQLWESQELLLDRIMELKRRGRPQKLLITKARQLGALDPETMVLTAELKWVPIGSINIGDKMVAFDEYPLGGNGYHRTFKNAEVLDKWEVSKEAFRITFENGKSIICTEDHPFLCRGRSGTNTFWRRLDGKSSKKVNSAKIVVGDVVRSLCERWEHTADLEDGWFSGLLDGEGSLRAKPNGGMELCVAQVDGPVLRRAIEYLTSRGYVFRMEVDNRKGGEGSKLGNKPVHKLVLHRAQHIFRLLGITKPSRFMDRNPWIGKGLPKGEDGNAWLKIVSIDSVGVRKMVDIRTTTATFIAEGLATHNCSQLIEGLITWRSVLFSGVNALIVSSTPSHAVYLFQMMQFSYDRLPWWMKPMTLSRKIDEGLVFDNPDHDTREMYPGLNSKIVVQAANQLSGVGEGRTITAAHCSEVSAWTNRQARDIIEGDLGNALADTVETFAIIETTPRGIGNYFHNLWTKSVELGDKADWQPVFLGWWFEKNRAYSIPDKAHWKMAVEESEMRARVLKEWTRCTNKQCGRYHESYWGGVEIIGSKCKSCSIGTMQPFRLSDEQLYWMELRRVNAQKDAESLKTLRQEMGSNSQECFVLSGIQVFPQEAMDQVIRHLEEPMIKGFFDKAGEVHGINRKDGKCPLAGCEIDHSFSDLPLSIYRLPKPGSRYVIGVDVAAGHGEKDSDYSVAFVNRVGGLHEADEHVATWRSNKTPPVEFAFPVAQLGYFYNEALISIEINRFDTTFSYVRQNYNYPNLYRWRNVDTSSQMSQRWGWVTNQRSKPRLWTTAIAWLKNRMWVIHDKELYKEMLTFQREDESEKKAEAHEGSFDDTCIAAMISLYCSHDSDWDDNLGLIPIPRYQSGDPDSYMWRIVCSKCKAERGVQSPEGHMHCMDCGSMFVSAAKNIKIQPHPDHWKDLEEGNYEGSMREPEYESL